MTKYGYARVSTEDQRTHGISLPAQIDLFLQQGILKENIFSDEGKSASVTDAQREVKLSKDFELITKIDLKKRPNLCNLINKVKPGDSIYFLNWSRLSRSFIQQESLVWMFKDRNVTLITLEGVVDPVTRRIMAIVNEVEVEQVGKRTNFGLKHRWEMGIHPGGKAMLGYKWVTTKINGNDYQTLEVVEENAKIVRKIFLMAIFGKSVKEIAETLGLRKQAIYRILKDKIYIGIVTFKGEEREGIHSPLLTVQQFELAQKNLGR